MDFLVDTFCDEIAHRTTDWTLRWMIFYEDALCLTNHFFVRVFIMCSHKFSIFCVIWIWEHVCSSLDYFSPFSPGDNHLVMLLLCWTGASMGKMQCSLWSTSDKTKYITTCCIWLMLCYDWWVYRLLIKNVHFAI